MSKKNTFQSISFNAAISKAKVKVAELEGRKHFVVPMVMLVEGVHKGNKGPLYYPEEELSKATDVWNHKPVIVYHPKDDKTACRPSVINSQKVGIILNTKWEDGKLKAEAWLDKQRVEQVDNRISKHLRSGRVMELSTGLYTENEKEEGNWNGEKYEAVARNYRPDHLALLPDRQGACSTKDGAGLLKNEMSFSNISSALQSAMMENYGYDVYVADVYDGFFVYQRGKKLYRQDYQATDAEVKVKGDPEQVQRVTEYRTKEGEVVGNNSTALTEKEVKSKNRRVASNSDNSKHKPGEKKMAKKGKAPTKEEMVDTLISNEATKWEKKHRKYLLARSERELDMMMPVMNREEEDPDDPNPRGKVKGPLLDDGDRPGENKDNKNVQDLTPAQRQAAEEREAAEAEEDDEPSQKAKGKKGKTDSESKTQNVSYEDWIKMAPPHVRASLARSEKIDKTLRKRCIDTITANSSNRFSKDQLEKKDTDELEALALLAAPADRTAEREVIGDWSGAIGAFTENAADDDEHLPLPVMNYGDSL